MPGEYMNTIKLVPRSAAGAKALGSVGQPVAQWVVLREVDEVSFSGREGPWLSVYPDVPNGTQYVRWVHATNDKDFQVIV
jgi:hypothetical protein